MNSNFMLAQLLVKYKLKEEQKEFKATTQVQHSSKVRDIQSNSAAFENEDYGANENDRMNPPKREPIRVENRVGRNDPCPCGSGKKYKNCHILCEFSPGLTFGLFKGQICQFWPF